MADTTPMLTLDRRYFISPDIFSEDTGEVLVDEPRGNDFWFPIDRGQATATASTGPTASRASFNLYSADPLTELLE